MRSREVVITGIGLVTPLADAVDGFVEALWSGRSGIGPIHRWNWRSYPVRIGGECTNFDPAQHGIDAREPNGWTGSPSSPSRRPRSQWRIQGSTSVARIPTGAGVIIGSASEDSKPFRNSTARCLTGALAA